MEVGKSKLFAFLLENYTVFADFGKGVQLYR
jgi:hypothetical protein